MDEKALVNLVRVGIVTAVNTAKRQIRVYFPSLNIPSGWLYVLQRCNAKVVVEPGNEHTHTIADTYTGAGSASTVPAHDHPGSYLSYWMPKINDKVLVLYIPIFNGDGFVLGGI